MILGRQPPANVEAEIALLGAILVRNAAFDRVSFLKPEHFADSLHGRVFESIGRLRDAGTPADPMTLSAGLLGEPELEKRGGIKYLATLATSAITVANAEHYGRTILDLSRRRAMIAAAGRLEAEAYDIGEDSPADVISRTQATLDALADDAGRNNGPVSAGDAANDALARLTEGKGAGISTGLASLDRVIGSLRNGQCIVLAGATGMGKSAAALGMAWAASAHGTVPFFSLEMSAEDVAARMLSIRSGVPLWQIAQNRLYKDTVERLQQAARELQGVPIIFDCAAAPTVRDMRRRCLDLQRKSALSLIVVDYLQLMCAEGRADNRAAEVASITRGLKVLAKELNAPVLALSQLSRKVDGRDNKRPELGDLRESGSIEQDADAVLFCYRPGYYEERKRPDRAKFLSREAHREALAAWEQEIRDLDDAAEIIVAKQRQGAANQVATVKFERQTAHYVDLPAGHDEQEAVGF